MIAIIVSKLRNSSYARYNFSHSPTDSREFPNHYGFIHSIDVYYMRLKDVKVKVRSILKEQEEARNNDGHLVAHFVAKYCSQLISVVADPKEVGQTVKMVQLSNFRKFPPIETITRARRIIQNKDKEFPPTLESVRKARRIKELDYRNWEVREATEHKSPELPYNDV